MEEDGQLSYWSVLFEASSFFDFLDRLSMVEEIAAADSRRLKEMRKAAEEVEAAKAELLTEREEMKAAKAMLDFGIGELNIKEFVAFHAVDNPASGAVMRKCGFKYEGNEIHTKFDGVAKLESKRHRLVVE